MDIPRIGNVGFDGPMFDEFDEKNKLLNKEIHTDIKDFLNFITEGMPGTENRKRYMGPEQIEVISKYFPRLNLFGKLDPCFLKSFIEVVDVEFNKQPSGYYIRYELDIEGMFNNRNNPHDMNLFTCELPFYNILSKRTDIDDYSKNIYRIIMEVIFGTMLNKIAVKKAVTSNEFDIIATKLADFRYLFNYECNQELND